MTIAVFLFLSAFIGYLFGAFPAGFLLVKATKKVDLREFGSGRTGGTNSFRAAGATVGIVTSILDVLKAACAVWAVRWLFGEVLPSSYLPWAEVSAGVLSVVGHNWSVFLGWRGGAGTGPNVGWAGAIWFPIVPIALVVVLGVLIGLGIASLASLAMSAIIPVAFAVLYIAGVEPYDSTLAYIVGGIISAAIIAWALRPNIERLLRGEERKVGPRSRSRQGQRAAKARNQEQGPTSLSP
jgi:glycerol-3-phosphate acyltransferase PlsY